MSKIALKPNENGTGVFSLEAPNSNTDRTLTLPDEAGSVLTDASDIEPQVKTATNASGDAPVYACRAWVNFNGEGTVSIRDSGNVSSITDNGTGSYTVNFSTAMPDTNYSVVISAASSSNGDYSVCGSASSSTSSANIQTSTGGGSSNSDREFTSVAIFR